MQTESETVIGWIRQLRQGETEAADALWRQYFDRLVFAAKKRLSDVPRRAADEEDVALSVLHCLCKGAADGRFNDLANHDDLWRLLLTITRQKCVDYVRHHTRDKRGGGEIRGESALAARPEESIDGFERMVAEQPDPQHVAQVGEQFERLLASLPEQVPREVILRRMEGWSVEEIASEFDISAHAVRRKLRLVRTIWRKLSQAERLSLDHMKRKE